jgi:hypothetical protein
LTGKLSWFKNSGGNLTGTWTENTITLWNGSGVGVERVNDYTVEVYTESGWIQVAGETGNTALDILASFPPTVASRVRIRVTSGDSYLKVYELEAF